MDNVYYLKLISGEDIIARIQGVDEYSDDIVLEYPVLVEYQSTGSTHYTAGMRPWIPGLHAEGQFVIREGDVMIMTTVGEQLSEFYERVVERNRDIDYEHNMFDEDDEDEEMSFANSFPVPGSTTIH